MQKLSILLLPVAALLFQYCGTPASGKSATAATSDTIPVQVMVLGSPSSLSSGVAVSGQFTTDDETMLSFKTGGVISAILVNEGDRIHKGQLLATLNLTEINTQVSQAQFNLEKAQRDYTRTQHLYADSVATLEQLQNAKTALDVASEQVRSARFNLDYSQIRATQDGYVLRKLANPGQVITSGTAVVQTNGAAATADGAATSGRGVGATSGHGVGATSVWLLKVGLSDQQWAMVHLGDKASIQTNALPNQTLTGTVSRKSAQVDPATGSFTADIRLTGIVPVTLASGLFGKGEIFPTATRPNGTIGATTHPNSATTHPNGTISATTRPYSANSVAAGSSLSGSAQNWKIPFESLLDGDGSSGYVFVASQDHRAQKVKVRIAGMEKDSVVIGSGLQEGQTLIVSGSAYLTDSSPIRIVEAAQHP
jgi:multidrug efflux pump subunit AcrA (membrane-fusion protein)